MSASRSQERAPNNAQIQTADTTARVSPGMSETQATIHAVRHRQESLTSFSHTGSLTGGQSLIVQREM